MRRYILRPGVCLSVCHKPVFHRKCWTGRAWFFGTEANLHWVLKTAAVHRLNLSILDLKEDAKLFLKQRWQTSHLLWRQLYDGIVIFNDSGINSLSHKVSYFRLSGFAIKAPCHGIFTAVYADNGWNGILCHTVCVFLDLLTRARMDSIWH